ncbi:MAG: response regulator transcription factor [Angustibacter sp.]
MALRIVLHEIGPPSELTQIFASAGYRVITCDGREEIERAVRLGCELVVLDAAAAEPSAICRDLRAQGSDVPVLVLAAAAEEEETVQALDAGADDYFIRPGHLPELLARVRAVLRRSGRLARPDARVRVDGAARRAFLDGRELTLSAKEFDLLSLLVGASGRVVTREQIMREVWRTEWFGATKTLDMHVSWLRRKLGEVRGRPQFIVTVRGVGFRFESGQCAGEDEGAIGPESKQGAEH